MQRLMPGRPILTEKFSQGLGGSRSYKTYVIKADVQTLKGFVVVDIELKCSYVVVARDKARIGSAASRRHFLEHYYKLYTCCGPNCIPFSHPLRSAVYTVCRTDCEAQP